MLAPKISLSNASSSPQQSWHIINDMQGLNVSDPQVTVILQGVGRGEGDAGGQPRSGGDGVDLKTDAK